MLLVQVCHISLSLFTADPLPIFLDKVAKHSFGSLGVYSFAKSWQEKGCSSQGET